MVGLVSLLEEQSRACLLSLSFYLLMQGHSNEVTENQEESPHLEPNHDVT